MNKDKEHYLNLFLIIAAPIAIVAGVLFVVISVNSSPAVPIGYLLICLGVLFFGLWGIRVLAMRSDKGDKDFKRFCKKYLTEKCDGAVIEITVLTGHNIGGAAKLQDQEYYSSTLKGIAYINEKGELIENDIKFTYYLNNKKPLNILRTKNLSVYCIECKKIKDKDLYYLLKIKSIQDNRFDEIIKEQLKPIIKDIDGVSFVFDKVFSQYEGKLNLESKEINITLEPDRDGVDATKSIETYKKIKSDFKNFYDTVLKKCSEGIVQWANDWNNDDDNHEITVSEIEKRIDKKNVVMEINGSDFSVYFDDDDLFYGHTIVYYGNIDDEKYSVDIAG